MGPMALILLQRAAMRGRNARLRFSMLADTARVTNVRIIIIIIIASAVLAIAIPSVCPSVRLSVTHRYCVKTTARSTVQFALLNSKMCLVL